MIGLYNKLDRPEVVIDIGETGFRTAMIPFKRKPEEKPTAYLNRLFLWFQPCVGFHFTPYGKVKVTQMFPEIFNNNWRRMHGKPLHRQPLKKRRKRY